jgi:polyhydroxybutyrate depolymerase
VLGRLAALICAGLLLAGCTLWPDDKPPSGFVNGTSVHHISVGGLDRTYRLHKPAQVSEPAPLVIVMHGYSGSARQVERAYQWDGLADSNKFVVAYPDGYGQAWNVDAQNCCGKPATEGVDDVAFITAVVADIGKNVAIDPRKVYAAGMSNGGIMSYTLACATGIFAAIGPVASIQLSACPSPRPASVVHIHGTADRLIPYGGGRGFSVISGPPVPQVNEFWRHVDQCGAPTATRNGAVTTSTAGCAQGRGVVLVTIDGGGHVWPPFASSMLWQFFAAHAR